MKSARQQFDPAQKEVELADRTSLRNSGEQADLLRARAPDGRSALDEHWLVGTATYAAARLT